nr:phage major tail protein 2 [uncultured Mediterranean phage uvMED]
MSVYFGSDGIVELKRNGGHAVFPTLKQGDVSTLKRRFTTSGEADQVFITGDQVSIERRDKTADGKQFLNLELVDGHNRPDWRGYVYVDEIGGIRLYNTFDDAIAGLRDNALELVEPSTATQNLKMRTYQAFYNCVSRIKSFDFTTERETMDTTVLNENFKSKYDAGLISGQGTLDCFWEHLVSLCGDDAKDDDGGYPEFPSYLAQLCLRLVQGADFLGRFFIYNSGSQSGETSVWYEAECIVTNVSVTVPAGGIVETSINFVTTGKVSLRTGYPPIELLQENRSNLLQEDGGQLYVGVDRD